MPLPHLSIWRRAKEYTLGCITYCIGCLRCKQIPGSKDPGYIISIMFFVVAGTSTKIKLPVYECLNMHQRIIM